MKDKLMMLVACLIAAAIATIIGYAVICFVEWKLPWEFEDHGLARIWFTFCLFVCIGAALTPDEEEKKPVTGPTPRK